MKNMEEIFEKYENSITEGYDDKDAFKVIKKNMHALNSIIDELNELAGSKWGKANKEGKELISLVQKIGAENKLLRRIGIGVGAQAGM